jgi:hypothetical protein
MFMKIAKFITALGVLAMTAVLLYGFFVGDFGKDGSEILHNPWGIVSLVDLYTGFTLYSAWVIYRERSLPLAILWTALIMATGFFAASLYALISLFQSDGDWQKFWMGKHTRG